MKAHDPGPATLFVPATNGSHTEPCSVRAAALAWEDWFRQATLAQQNEALVLAQRQGYISAQQLPAPANGAKPHLPLTHDDGLQPLRTILAGKCDALVAHVSPPCDFVDAALTAAQQIAVRRLHASPDVALLRAKPGPAAVVLAEVILQAARAGQRVLFLAQQAAALDQVLQRLHGRDAVLPIRFLAVGESAAQLAPPIRATTLEAQRQLFQTNTLAQAQAARSSAEERCRRRHDEEPLWPEFAKLADRAATLEAKRQALQKRCDEAPGEVRREAESVPSSGKTMPSGPFAMQVVELIQHFNQQALELEQAERALDEKRGQLRAEALYLAHEQAKLRPLTAAKERGRWWTMAWWRATCTRNLAGRTRSLTQRRADLDTALTAAGEESQQFANQRQELETQLAADRECLIVAECERRRHEWAGQIGDINKELEPIRCAWRALSSRLESAQVPPAPTPAAVSEAKQRWRDAREHDEAACLFARQWASFLQETAPHFVAQLPRYASLLAGTIGALAKNSEFAEFADGPFDLVIIDDADRLLENDLLRLARKGRRWLLVGQVAAAANGRPSTFDKLWQALHADPSTRLAYRWSKEGERWRCQLRAVAAKDRPYLETERLADFPEIELGILALPKTRPQLAQVVFPTTMTLAQAKQFIYRELQEAAIQPAGRGAYLEERADAWTLHLGVPAAEPTPIDLEAGVREWVTPAGLTHRLDFAKSAPWQLPQVEDWLRRHANLRDPARTFELV